MESAKYPKTVLEVTVKESISFAELLRKLGKKWSGGQQQNIKRWIKRYELDTSHFLGQAANCGVKHKGGPEKRHWSKILVYNESIDWREKVFRIRRALIESGVDYKCNLCFCDGTWMGKQIKLQINHINGNWKDNRKENLEFLCPNCHSTTEGWSGNKGLTGIVDRSLGDKVHRQKKKAMVAEQADAHG